MRIGMASYARISARMVAFGVGLALLGRTGLSLAEDVPATGKGMVGGGLLGAEVFMLGEAAFHAKSPVAYLIGGVVGAGCGVALGYVAEQNADSKVSVYMLAGGMALVIPTTVAVLSAAAYSPPEDYRTEDAVPAPGVPVSEPPQPGMSPVIPPPPTSSPPPVPPGSPPPTSWHPAMPLRPLALHYHWSHPTLRVTPGLLAANDEGLRFSVPAVEVRPVYSAAEIAKFGLTQQQELRLTVFSATF